MEPTLVVFKNTIFQNLVPNAFFMYLKRDYVLTFVSFGIYIFEIPLKINQSNRGKINTMK